MIKRERRKKRMKREIKMKICFEIGTWSSFDFFRSFFLINIRASVSFLIQVKLVSFSFGVFAS